MSVGSNFFLYGTYLFKNKIIFNFREIFDYEKVRQQIVFPSSFVAVVESKIDKNQDLGYGIYPGSGTLFVNTFRTTTLCQSQLYPPGQDNEFGY